LLPLFLFAAACGGAEKRTVVAAPRPSILFVTLDTTRADAIGPDQTNVETPSFNALVRRGRLFRQAYTAVPQTLPSHTSMLTGLYPAGHGVHENARYVAGAQTLLAEQLKNAGYRTAAFVSAFALARRFGLARGFEVYDDDFGHDRAERPASETTDHVLAYLAASAPEKPLRATMSTEALPTNAAGRAGQALFLWVHYYDPHYPYTPPEPFRSRYAKQPYFGEVAFMDQQLGRLVQAVQERVHGPLAIIIVGDHGEGLGEHGESQHGNLLYQPTVRVPLLLMGPGVRAGVIDAPVSSRRVYHTMLDWAGLGAANSLRGTEREIVLGEAMKPMLDFGWQPQVMAVEGRQKAILSGGRTEIYDVIADPKETRDLGSQASLSRSARAALREYPIPSPQAARLPANLSDEDRKKLASLGYVASETKPVIRNDAPRPVEMVRLFDVLDQAAGLFVREQYAAAIPLLERILVEDPHNLDAALRLATAQSSLGHDAAAEAAFRKAEAIAPDSADVRTYLALHYARGKEWQRAVPLLERIVADDPDRLPAAEALAVIRERQGRIEEAIQLRQRIHTKRAATAAELVSLGEMAMSVGQTAVAIDAFEGARALQGGAFDRPLELGVLYLEARRFEDARAALDRVPPNSAGYPMALFKRAQVSVLLHEADQASRIELARKHADATTRELIARERLFQDAGASVHQ
jgi:arylsulfatase A-like enzyme/tetratricopeptide (TPR) repeat protein